MVIVTNSLLEQGISSNGSWSKKQLLALGVPIRKRFKLIKGWKDRLIGSEITEQQKTRFLELTNKHIKHIHPEPLLDWEAMNRQHLREIVA